MAVPTNDTVALQTGMAAMKAMAIDGEGEGLVAAGGVAAVVGGMQAHVGVAEVQEEGFPFAEPDGKPLLSRHE